MFVWCFLQGANQAVAAARLTQGSNRTVRFVCRFGNDSYAYLLEQELVSNNVDVTGCQKVTDMPSGYGMVMLEPDGAASSVVLGGANTAWKKVMTGACQVCKSLLLFAAIEDCDNYLW